MRERKKSGTTPAFRSRAASADFTPCDDNRFLRQALASTACVKDRGSLVTARAVVGRARGVEAGEIRGGFVDLIATLSGVATCHPGAGAT